MVLIDPPRTGIGRIAAIPLFGGHFERWRFERVLTLLPTQLAKAANFVDWNKDEPVPKIPW
jgi:hypothetical protein